MGLRRYFEENPDSALVQFVEKNNPLRKLSVKADDGSAKPPMEVVKSGLKVVIEVAALYATLLVTEQAFLGTELALEVASLIKNFTK